MVILVVFILLQEQPLDCFSPPQNALCWVIDLNVQDTFTKLAFQVKQRQVKCRNQI